MTVVAVVLVARVCDRSPAAPWRYAVFANRWTAASSSVALLDRGLLVARCDRP